MSEEEKNEFAYKRDNGEDIIDPVAIRSCKDEQNRDIIENQRLGSYDKYGNYILIPEIRQELINIPKLVYNTREEENCKIFDLSAKIPLFENLYFKLKISNIEAVLYITETITREAGEYVEVYEEVVDSLSLQEEKIPQSIIFRTFNIFENDDDYGQEFEDFYGFENILTRKVYLSLLANELLGETDEEEQESFKLMLETLKNGGEYGQRVLQEFMKRLSDRKEVFDINNTGEYNRATNEILLSSIDIVTTEKDLKNDNNKNIYLKVINIRNRNISKHIKNAQQKVDEKYVKEATNKATRAFLEKNQDKENEVKLQFQDKLSKKIIKKNQEKRELKEPIIKQLVAKKKAEQALGAKKQEEKESKQETKEDKIKEILNKKQEQSKSVKKVVASNAQRKAGKSKGTKKRGAKKDGRKKKGASVKKKSGVGPAAAQQSKNSVFFTAPKYTPPKPIKVSIAVSSSSSGSYSTSSSVKRESKQNISSQVEQKAKSSVESIKIKTQVKQSSENQKKTDTQTPQMRVEVINENSETRKSSFSLLAKSVNAKNEFEVINDNQKSPVKQTENFSLNEQPDEIKSDILQQSIKNDKEEAHKKILSSNTTNGQKNKDRTEDLGPEQL